MSKPDFYVIELYADRKRLFTTAAATPGRIYEEIRRVRPRVADANHARITTWKRELVKSAWPVGGLGDYSRWTRIERYQEELR
jgi:hypothetical protein